MKNLKEQIFEARFGEAVSDDMEIRAQQAARFIADLKLSRVMSDADWAPSRFTKKPWPDFESKRGPLKSIQRFVNYIHWFLERDLQEVNRDKCAEVLEKMARLLGAPSPDIHLLETGPRQTAIALLGEFNFTNAEITWVKANAKIYADYLAAKEIMTPEAKRILDKVGSAEKLAAEKTTQEFIEVLKSLRVMPDALMTTIGLKYFEVLDDKDLIKQRSSFLIRYLEARELVKATPTGQNVDRKVMGMHRRNRLSFDLALRDLIP